MLPSEINVSGINYKVKEVDGLIVDRDFLGTVSYPKSLIKIDSSMSSDKKEQVFVHELMHAIFYESGYDEHEEEMVNRLGITLYQVLKDNDLSFAKADMAER